MCIGLYYTIENLAEFQRLTDVEAPDRSGATQKELLPLTTTFGVGHYIYPLAGHLRCGELKNIAKV
jgi:hypothetical protein